MTKTREIWCCGCGRKISARLTNGAEIYPHRVDLANVPFWKCDECGNSVGCHHKTTKPTKPLGCIATPELKNARREIHRVLDPIWHRGLMGRKEIYAVLSGVIGREYHTADIRSIDEARRVYKAIKSISQREAA